MLNINPMSVPTLLLAGAIFWVGRLGYLRMRGWARAGYWIVALAAALPAICYAVYYLHILDEQRWFFELRTLPYSELAASFAGLLAGGLSTIGRVRNVVSPTLSAAALFLLILTPYAKSVIAPAQWSAMKNRWSGGVCRQSMPSSCGPASAATLANFAGIPATEEELARESFTTGTGTEIWYLARALRRRGLPVEYRFLPPTPSRLPYPAIAGTRLGENGAGHFIVILGETPDAYQIADPLINGTCEIRKRFLNRQRYWFTGFFLVAPTLPHPIPAKSRAVPAPR